MNKRPGTLAPKEHDEQVTVVSWARMMSHKCPCLALLHAIPNGARLRAYKTRSGKRWSPEAKHLKDEGLLPGIPDLFLPHAAHGYHGFYLEMKRVGARPTGSQFAMLDALREQGYKAEWAQGNGQAIQLLSQYLDLPAY